MLLAAKQRGALIFEAFSNTPPYWMTVSGRSSGNVFPWLDNLRPEYYDQFVHYLTEVVRWYRDQHDITFRCLISPALRCQNVSLQIRVSAAHPEEVQFMNSCELVFLQPGRRH